jgi:polyhydroxybutyrate depolymerase
MKRCNNAVCGALLSLAVISLLAKPVAAEMETRPLTHNGYERPYLVYKPAHLPLHPAVVFMLGGIRSTARSESQEFGWIEKADANGFVVVFPDPVATNPEMPADRKTNVTFWEMEGSRTHVRGSGKLPVDDDGYLTGVLHEVIHLDNVDRRRVFFAGFSSGSGMVQLFASRHAGEVAAITAVATPLMHPPVKLARPVSVLYIHGDNDEQFSGFETNSKSFATTPHGNWVTWGYLDGCQVQSATKVGWGVHFSWKNCKGNVQVVADFITGLDHDWPGSTDSHWNEKQSADKRLSFTDMSWNFFSTNARR